MPYIYNSEQTTMPLSPNETLKIRQLIKNVRKRAWLSNERFSIITAKREIQHLHDNIADQKQEIEELKKKLATDHARINITWATDNADNAGTMRDFNGLLEQTEQTVKEAKEARHTLIEKRKEKANSWKISRKNVLKQLTVNKKELEQVVKDLKDNPLNKRKIDVQRELNKVTNTIDNYQKKLTSTSPREPTFSEVFSRAIEQFKGTKDKLEAELASLNTAISNDTKQEEEQIENLETRIANEESELKQIDTLLNPGYITKIKSTLPSPKNVASSIKTVGALAVAGGAGALAYNYLPTLSSNRAQKRPQSTTYDYSQTYPRNRANGGYEVDFG